MKKKLLSFLLIIGIGLTVLPSSSKSSDNTWYAHALWTAVYSSGEDLAEAADSIIIGTVIRQETEIRCGVVFTDSYILVEYDYLGNAGEEICLLQTGGTCSGNTSPAIYGADILTLNSTYLLYLQYSPADATYEEYYLILGGGQGVLPAEIISSGAGLSAYDTQFSDEDIISGNLLHFDEGGDSALSATDTGTPKYGGLWDVSEIEYYIYSISGASSSYYTRVGNGIELWNGISDGISLSETDNSLSPDLMIYSYYYGTTGWYGYSYMYNIQDEQTYTEVYYWAKIQLNISSMSYTETSSWKIVACHEAGHILGLDHAAEGSASVMLNDWDTISTEYPKPQSMDKTAIRYLYGD